MLDCLFVATSASHFGTAKAEAIMWFQSHQHTSIGRQYDVKSNKASSANALSLHSDRR